MCRPLSPHVRHPNTEHTHSLSLSDSDSLPPSDTGQHSPIALVVSYVEQWLPLSSLCMTVWVVGYLD